MVNRLPKDWQSGRDSGEGQVQLPLGASSSEERASLRAGLEALDASRAPQLLRAEDVSEAPNALVLTFSDRASSLALPTALSGWRAQPARTLPLALSLANFLFEARVHLRNVERALTPVGAEQVRFSPEPRDAWRLLLVPRRLSDPPSPGAFGTWASPAVLRGDAYQDLTFAAGAAMHELIAGDLHPAELSRGARRERQLAGQAGRSDRLRAALESALPPSLQQEADDLHLLILDLLRRPPDPDQARERLRSLIADRLSARRVSLRWEDAGRPKEAAAVLEYAYPIDVDPIAQVRLCVAQGKYEEGFEWALKALKAGHEDGAEHCVGFVEALAGGEGGHTQLAETLAQIDEAASQLETHLDEVTRIRMAWVEATVLEDTKAAQKRLVRFPFVDDYNDVVRRMLEARIMAATTRYAELSKRCEQGVNALARVPQAVAHGYCTAYFTFLNGVAHVGAVSSSSFEPAYLADALKLLATALELARKSRAKDIEEAALGWLTFLEQVSAGLGGPAEAVRIGVRALLSTVAPARVPSTNPQLPWLDRELVFRQLVSGRRSFPPAP